MIKAFIERVLPRKKAVRVEHSGKTLGIVSEHMSRNAVYVCDKLQRAGFEAYIVGGAVRDALLG